VHGDGGLGLGLGLTVHYSAVRVVVNRTSLLWRKPWWRA